MNGHATGLPHSPISAAQQMQAMAGKIEDKKLSMVLTGLSVMMLTVMLAREAGILPLSNWQDRETSRRRERDGERGR